MSGLTNKYVEDFGKKHCENFIGVFPCNIHPKLDRNTDNFSIIFNESKHNENGSHFVAIYANKNIIYYFDSLGLKCENEYILKFIQSFRKTLLQNNLQIQSYNSIFCGYFCLAFIIFISSQKSINELKKFYDIFNVKNLKLNDKIVSELLIELLK